MADVKGSITRLVMTFLTSDADKKVSLSMDHPKDTVGEAEIKAAMQSVLDSNIFSVNGASIVGLVEAKMVVTNTDEYDLV